MVYPFAWAPPTGNLAYCMPRVGTRACLYVPDCYGQRAIVVGNARTNGGASCFNDVQSRGLVTEHGKQLLLHADALGLTDGCYQTVLGVDRLCLQAGEGKCMLRATEGIYIQESSVTVRTPLAVNQHRTGEEGKGKKNPATGGEKTSIQSQYEFSISSPLGELIGTEYENYNHFENEIQYESYRAVEIRRLDGLLKGIATAVAIGALVTAVALTGGAALGVALAVGAVVAGVGCAASAVTYMRDRENNTASSPLTYIRNSGIASLITASIIAMFWEAPYAAEAVTLEVTHGMPLVMLFFMGVSYWGQNKQRIHLLRSRSQSQKSL